MSIIYCEKHDRRWDSDYLEDCPICEIEVVDRIEDSEEVDRTIRKKDEVLPRL